MSSDSHAAHEGRIRAEWKAATERVRSGPAADAAARRAAFLANPEDPRHGTYNGYQELQCRCARCTAANTGRQQAYKTKRRP